MRSRIRLLSGVLLGVVVIFEGLDSEGKTHFHR